MLDLINLFVDIQTLVNFLLYFFIKLMFIKLYVAVIVVYIFI